jgi:uncharacterized protein (DUF427 family)
MTVVVCEARTGTLLARGVLGRDVVKYQGSLYFRPEAVVAQSVLRPTNRTATSPTLGTSQWLDLVAAEMQSEPNAPPLARSVAWIYADPRPGHDLIRGRYGFHPGNRGATRQTIEP